MVSGFSRFKVAHRLTDVLHSSRSQLGAQELDSRKSLNHNPNRCGLWDARSEKMAFKRSRWLVLKNPWNLSDDPTRPDAAIYNDCQPVGTDRRA
jgi:hypothetical protein